MDLPTHAVKAILQKEGRILLLQRNKDSRGEDNWDLPGGLIEEGQSPEDALYREIQEELGIEATILKPGGTWSFIRKKDGATVSVQNYLCEMKNPDAKITLSEEHSAFQWIMPEEITNFPVKDPSLFKSIQDIQET